MRGVIGKMLRGASEIAGPAALMAQRAQIMEQRDERLAQYGREALGEKRGYEQKLKEEGLAYEQRLTEEEREHELGMAGDKRAHERGLVGLKARQKRRRKAPTVKDFGTGEVDSLGKAITEPKQYDHATETWIDPPIAGGVKDRINEDIMGDAKLLANKWINDQAGYLRTDKEDFGKYGGNRTQARAEKTREFYDKLMGMGAQSQDQPRGADQFEVGKPYVDATGNKATYLGDGKWKEL